MTKIYHISIIYLRWDISPFNPRINFSSTRSAARCFFSPRRTTNSSRPYIHSLSHPPNPPEASKLPLLPLQFYSYSYSHSSHPPVQCTTDAHTYLLPWSSSTEYPHPASPILPPYHLSPYLNPYVITSANSMKLMFPREKQNQCFFSTYVHSYDDIIIHRGLQHGYPARDLAYMQCS